MENSWGCDRKHGSSNSTAVVHSYMSGYISALSISSGSRAHFLRLPVLANVLGTTCLIMFISMTSVHSPVQQALSVSTEWWRMECLLAESDKETLSEAEYCLKIQSFFTESIPVQAANSENQSPLASGHFPIKEWRRPNKSSSRLCCVKARAGMNGDIFL